MPEEHAHLDPVIADSGHLPVLSGQLLQLFGPVLERRNKPIVILDCTLGRAGHAALLAPKLGPQDWYIGLDVDPDNIAYAQARIASTAKTCRFDAKQTNFTCAKAVLAELAVQGVDLLLADLGFASNQMDDPRRGLSFSHDGPLDMRLDPDLPQTAADLVNGLPEEDLANLIYQYGEERLSRKIARKIVEERHNQPILTTERLADIVRRAYGPRNPKAYGKKTNPPGQRHRSKAIHPATRTFMALRIAVNGELDALDQLLADLPDLMNPRGVAAIISFHSLEDRRVKQAFLAWQQQSKAQRLTRKPLTASDEEQYTNPRSRSAKLRAIEFY